MKTKHCVGVDVGGTKILGVVCDVLSGEVIGSERVVTPDDPDELAEKIELVVAGLIEDCAVEAIGVGLPGLVDYQGILHYGPNVPGVAKLDMPKRLRQRFGCPATANNDGSCAAVAEHRFGAAKGHGNVVLTTLGTGVGGGVIAGGSLLRGFKGFAVEPGHNLVDANGFRCACGLTGCWETVASGTGLANLARRAATQGQASDIVARAGGDIGAIRGEHISQSLRSGDGDARRIFEEFTVWVIRGLGSLVSIFDPEIIVVGGGLVALSKEFLGEVNDQLMSAVMGGSQRPKVPVVAARFGAEAGALGAAGAAADLLTAS